MSETTKKEIIQCAKCGQTFKTAKEFNLHKCPDYFSMGASPFFPI